MRPTTACAWFATRIGGEGLWFTDGTTAGTTQVAAFAPPQSPLMLPGFTPAGSRRMFFRGTGSPGFLEPWASDGTAAGTGLLQSPGGFGSSLPSRGVLAGGAVYFTATDYVATGRELYRWFPGASSQLVGDGLASVGLAPRLFATDPVIGGSITFDGDAQPNALGVVVVGTPAAPLGSFFGADLLVQLPAPVLLPVNADAQGNWSVPPIGLPNVPGLTGIRLAAQGVFTVSGPLDLTNGALLTFGL